MQNLPNSEHLDWLPIDPLIPQIVDALHTHPSIVITAPPGAGKTTRVPRALYEAGFASNGNILILEPRRLAARLAADRVAAELGQEPGQTVGYTIRFEHVGGPATRIRFLTEGVFSRRILHDPLLTDVTTVILDEFHERHLSTDVALAFLRKLQMTERPELRLLVMSATLDAEPLAAFLGQAPILRSEGRLFENRIEFEDKRSDRPLEQKIAAVVAKILHSEAQGDILVFLPGAAEIRRTLEHFSGAHAPGEVTIAPLHGDLPPREQARAVLPSKQRKVILATNVAETSITIPGITAVIDSGLARTAGYSPWSGFPTLSLTKISKASAHQRAGRAGRTQPGMVFRLYTKPDYDARPDSDKPEIRRCDLSETVLTLRGAGVGEITSLPWFDPPPQAAIQAAEDLLIQLRALDGARQVTDIGKRMLRFPLHPRLTRMIDEGERQGVLHEATVLAALLSERDIRLDVRSDLSQRNPLRTQARPGRYARPTAPSDLLDMLERFKEARDMGSRPTSLSLLEVEPRALHSVEKTARQLERLARKLHSPSQSAHSAHEVEEALLIATLAGFPDRVAKRRSRGSYEFLCTNGGAARLSPGSVVHEADLIVAVEADEQTLSLSHARPVRTQIRLASAIEPEWLAALYPESIVETSRHVWNSAAGRVDESRRTSYGQITLEESVRPASPSLETSRLLSEAAIARGVSVFADGDEISTLFAKMDLLRRCFPEADFSEIGDEELNAAVRKACNGKYSFDELATISIVPYLTEGLTPLQNRVLRRETPDRVLLPGGRSVRIRYERGKPPWIQSRLQDFFGMLELPTLCAGRVAITVHLLAPNNRAVQVTQDLGGFWSRHYPSLRRELQRRYPKHAWPEHGHEEVKSPSHKGRREKK